MVCRNVRRVVAAGKRSFWLHQIAEYIVGGALVGTGLQASDPLVPTALGVLIVVNTMIANGPLGAFRKVSRRVHHIFDFVVVLIAVAACLAPGLDGNTRLIQALIVVVLIVVVARTDYALPSGRPITELSAVPDGRADEIGRLAGRAIGTVAGRARMKWRRDGDDSA